MIQLIVAHPALSTSRVNRALLDAVRELPDLSIRSLYDLYPDAAIDAPAERRELAAAELIIIQHPIYWYAAPGMLKLWFDEVLSHGWAYGPGGNALRGKPCLWAATTGGDDDSYSPRGAHGRPFEQFHAPMEQLARFCGLTWLEPFIVQDAHHLSDETLAQVAARYRTRVLEAFTHRMPSVGDAKGAL